MKSHFANKLVKLLMVSASSLIFFMLLNQLNMDDSIQTEDFIEQRSFVKPDEYTVEAQESPKMPTQAHIEQLQEIRMHNTYRMLEDSPYNLLHKQGTVFEEKSATMKKENQSVKQLVLSWEREYLAKKDFLQ